MPFSTEEGCRVATERETERERQRETERGLKVARQIDCLPTRGFGV